MKIKIVYESKTGNTELIAKSIKKSCEKDNTVIFKSVEQALEDEKKDGKIDLYFLGSWTDKGNCGEKMKKYCKDLEDQKIAIFGTAGFGGSKEYYENLTKRFSNELPENNEILDGFYCQGKMPIGVKSRYESMLKKNPEDKDLKVNIENFEDAQSHPDEKDLEDIKNFAKIIMKNLQ